jgi:regulatory factor X
VRTQLVFVESWNLSACLYSDWIALNVLRNVALSTTSVAASVEPVMQQHFITLSPMIGHDSFGTNQPAHLMNHTPTTSSMLAALQQEPYPSGPLDPSSTGFAPDNYGLPPFMDTSGGQDDALGGVHPGGLSFPDYVTSSGSTFDVTFTPQDLGISTSGPASGEQGSEGEVVKTEG